MSFESGSGKLLKKLTVQSGEKTYRNLQTLVRLEAGSRGSIMTSERVIRASKNWRLLPKNREPRSKKIFFKIAITCQKSFQKLFKKILISMTDWCKNDNVLRPVHIMLIGRLDIFLTFTFAGPGSSVLNKSVPRPPMNVLSAPSGQTSQTSYAPMQQQTPGSMMVRPGLSTNSMGMKRKLEED